MDIMLTLTFSAVLAFIPAIIAKNKGYSFGLWWLYGWLLFIVAIIHVCLKPNKKAQQPPINAGQSVADELKKYKELKDEGVLTEEEFQAKKKQLLGL